MADEFVFVAEYLAEVGCPYGALEPETKVWLEGYRAGHKAAGQLAIATAQQTIAEMNGERTQ